MRKEWSELNVDLHPEVQNAIQSFKFCTMTPVQAATIPLLLNMKDVATEAVTGMTFTFISKSVYKSCLGYCRFRKDACILNTFDRNTKKKSTDRYMEAARDWRYSYKPYA